MSQHVLPDIVLKVYTASAALFAGFVHLYWLVKSLNRHLTRTWESKPPASQGSLSAISSCRAVGLATAQVSCLLAQAVEVDLVFPCNPEHMGGSCAH